MYMHQGKIRIKLNERQQTVLANECKDARTIAMRAAGSRGVNGGMPIARLVHLLGSQQRQ